MDVLEPVGMVGEDTALLDEMARHIRELNLQHGVPWARAVGEYVLEKFFHRDVELYHTRARKHVSLRKLGQRKDIGISRTTLGRFIGVAILCRSLPRKVVGELELNQGYALLQVPPDQVKKAAEKAVQQGLDRAEIAAEFPNPALKPKVKGATPFGTTLRSVKRHVAALGKTAAAYGLTAKPAKVAATRRELLALREQLDATLAVLPDDGEAAEDDG